MNEDSSKQKIIDNIKSVDTVLVTVSTNPSVDELSAAMGLSLFINDLDKRATAVVSGNIPPAINFLEPEKTFENSVDSLRDFVIALDKEKADHLRYKVDGDVVKIFITPYKTIISSDDLEYSQGDYNVEMVIAIGVKDQEHLDKALEAHGRILHDAIVATVGMEQSQLGSVDYSDPGVSSVSELVTNIVTAIADEETKMSEQVASALLTGIVSATDRFSNERTTSQVMSVAAKLMSSGANQQLIASKLREGSKMPMVDDQASEKIEKDSGEKTLRKKRTKNRGLNVDHNDDNKPKPVKKVNKAPAAEALEQILSNSPPSNEENAPSSEKTAVVETPDVDQSPDTSTAEQLLDSALGEVPESDSGSSTMPNLAEELAEAASSEAESSADGKDVIEKSINEATEQKVSKVQAPGNTEDKPSFGGVLNATTEQAAEDKRRLEQVDRNRTILSHDRPSDGFIDGLGTPPPINGAGQVEEQTMVNPMQEPSEVVVEPELPAVQQETPKQPVDPVIPTVPTQTLADIDEQNRQTPQEAVVSEAIETPPSPVAGTNDAASSALDAVNAAFDAAPPMTPPPITTPAIEALRQNQQANVPAQPTVSDTPEIDLSGSIPTPPPPPPPDFGGANPAIQGAPMPDFSQLPTPPAVPAMSDITQPINFDTMQAPIGPDVATLPPENLGSILPPQQETLPPAPQSNDPGQFKIPGQQ